MCWGIGLEICNAAFVYALGVVVLYYLVIIFMSTQVLCKVRSRRGVFFYIFGVNYEAILTEGEEIIDVWGAFMPYRRRCGLGGCVSCFIVFFHCVSQCVFPHFWVKIGVRQATPDTVFKGLVNALGFAILLWRMWCVGLDIDVVLSIEITEVL